jgi:hypothetical protein
MSLRLAEGFELFQEQHGGGVGRESETHPAFGNGRHDLWRSLFAPWRLAAMLLGTT